MSDDRDRREVYAAERRQMGDDGTFLSIPALPLFSDVPVEEYSRLVSEAEDQLAWAYEARRLAQAKVWRDGGADAKRKATTSSQPHNNDAEGDRASSAAHTD